MRCCDCEFRDRCDDTQKVLTAFVKCYRREEFLNSKSRKKQATNGDRIRAMSDEELASFMMYPVCKYTGCKGDCTEKNIGVTGCRKKILNWLQQPAKEE